MNDENKTDWLTYQRFVASLYSEHASDTLTVTPNAELVGISGIPRQIDLLIDARLDEDVSRRIIIDAKRHTRKIDIKQVEAFEGMMRDCRAQRGIIVCSSGFTEGAKRRAQEQIGLRLVPLEDLEKLDLTTWEPCRSACNSKKVDKDKGWVLYDQPIGFTVNDSPLSIVVIGKCDKCRNFQIWCWNCGSKFALADETEHHCGCDWFFLTAIEEEGENERGTPLRAVLLFLVMLKGAHAIIPVDRRPLA
jgi:hypothetical protein